MGVVTMASTDYQINWRNFQPWACESIRNLFEDQNFTDVTLISDDLQELRAHKVILSSCSPFFEKVLKSNSNPQPLLYLKGINFDTLSLILRFVYEGEVNVPHDVVNTFMMTANEIKIKGLNFEAVETNSQTGHKRDGKMDPLEESMLETELVDEEFRSEEKEMEKPGLDEPKMDIAPPLQYKLKVIEDFEDPILPQNLPADNEISSKDEDGSRFRCQEQFCDKTFKNSRLVENHTKRVHLGEKTVQCPECPKKFFSAGEVESHRTYLHFTTKNFNCTMCSKTFVKMADANLHMKGVHLKIREHECKFCGKKFTQSSNMHTHMRRNHFEEWAKWKTSQMSTTSISAQFSKEYIVFL